MEIDQERPFYSCLLSDQANVWQRGCRLYGPHCFYHVNRVVVMLTIGLYQNKVTGSLASSQKPGNSATTVKWSIRGQHSILVEFVVGSRLCSEGFSPGSPVFPSPQKPTLPNSNSIWKVSPIRALR